MMSFVMRFFFKSQSFFSNLIIIITVIIIFSIFIIIWCFNLVHSHFRISFLENSTNFISKSLLFLSNLSGQSRRNFRTNEISINLIKDSISECMRSSTMQTISLSNRSLFKISKNFIGNFNGLFHDKSIDSFFTRRNGIRSFIHIERFVRHLSTGIQFRKIQFIFNDNFIVSIGRGPVLRLDHSPESSRSIISQIAHSLQQETNYSQRSIMALVID